MIAKTGWWTEAFHAALTSPFLADVVNGLRREPAPYDLAAFQYPAKQRTISRPPDTQPVTERILRAIVAPNNSLFVSLSTDYQLAALRLIAAGERACVC